MPIDFFANPHITSSSNAQFGLCDDPSPATNPAYIDEYDQAKWIAKVTNSNNYNVELFPIDHCIDIRRPNGDLESRCDGMVKYETLLIFVELKERMGKGWVGDAKKQLETTIAVFKANHDTTPFSKIEAYICNSLKPAAVTGNGQLQQEFFNNTGCNLTIQREIIL